MSACLHCRQQIADGEVVFFAAVLMIHAVLTIHWCQLLCWALVIRPTLCRLSTRGAQALVMDDAAVPRHFSTAMRWKKNFQGWKVACGSLFLHHGPFHVLCVLFLSPPPPFCAMTKLHNDHPLVKQRFS